jgi:FG-GAP-like repeat
MFGVGTTVRWSLAATGLVAVWAGVFQSLPVLPQYSKFLTLGPGIEWRFNSLAVDLNRDGHLDLVATARLVDDSLHIWRGNGEGAFSQIESKWSDIGYAALATGDINRDGFPDIVAASHFGSVQTLLSDGKGGFTEKLLHREDGYVVAQLADLNGDGQLDLVLLGFQKAGIEVYLGDGTGNWKLHTTLPGKRPGPSMPGRSLVIGDVNGDDHPDIIAAFQRWGIYIYQGDGRGGFKEGPMEFDPPTHEFKSLALGDVNKDGHLDLVINGTFYGFDKPNGPDVYLGDGSGGWKASSAGLKVLKLPSSGVALGDLDRDGNLDIVASGNVTVATESDGLFWFRGDGKGGWHLVQESGLPTSGLSLLHSVTLAELYHDGFLEVIAVSGNKGSITIWRPTLK